ncbi:Putative zinc- or iron-chelating domain protein [uncultured archaeon]|nr:Putative zinc- or iron-chelating domain protein [uncultured archaeon]
MVYKAFVIATDGRRLHWFLFGCLAISLMAASPSIVNSCRDCTARCCRGLAVVLTIPEAKRMVAEIGLAPDEFLEFSNNINSRETPHYPLLVRHGSEVLEYFIILKRRRKVECAFLEEDLRCSVYEHRPHVCRLYPFDLEGKNVKKGALCPVKFVREAGTEEIARQLGKDLIEHGKIARKWAVKHGNKVPEMKKFAEYFGKD